jgi:hypothetical protein
VVLENCDTVGNRIDFNFSMQMKKLTTWDFIKNPILTLFPPVTLNEAMYSVPNSFGFRVKIANDSYGLTYVVWYPENENQFRVHIYFFECAVLSPIISFLFRKMIRKTRQTIINEDRSILQTIPKDFVNYRIHLKNDKIMLELRRILQDQFGVEI